MRGGKNLVSEERIVCGKTYLVVSNLSSGDMYMCDGRLALLEAQTRYGASQQHAAKKHTTSFVVQRNLELMR